MKRYVPLWCLALLLLAPASARAQMTIVSARADTTGPNPTVTVAANGINNAKVADGALSPGKIAGTAATVGSNIFNGVQVVNGALGIGAAPAFNLHVVGPGRVETRVHSTGF